MPAAIRVAPSSTLGSAILLNGTCLAPLAAEQQVGIRDLTEIQNPLDVPIIVDEISVVLGYGSFGTPAAAALGGDVSIRMTLGGDQLTSIYVPLWLLGPIKNLNPLSAGVGAANFSSKTPCDLNSGIFSLRLSSELILYPHEYIQPVFNHYGNLTTVSTPQAPSIQFRCRALEPSAKRNTLPWITHWQGSLQALGANYLEQTKEGDLANPFDTPLYVDRMMGVIGTKSTNAYGLYGVTSASGLGNGPDLGFAPPTNSSPPVLQGCTLRMVDGSGRPIIRDFTPFAHVFQTQQFGWNMKATLDPSSFWIAYLQENYSAYSNGGYAQAMMSLIGKRKVKA